MPTSRIKSDLSNRIQAVRKKIGLRQQDLADRLGVGLATVVRWEGGRITPGMDVGQHLIEMLPNLNTRWLMTGEGEMLSQPDADADVDVLLSKLEQMLAEFSALDEDDDQFAHFGTAAAIGAEIARRRGMEPLRSFLDGVCDVFFGMTSKKYRASLWWYGLDEGVGRTKSRRRIDEIFWRAEETPDVSKPRKKPPGRKK